MISQLPETTETVDLEVLLGGPDVLLPGVTVDKKKTRPVTRNPKIEAIIYGQQ